MLCKAQVHHYHDQGYLVLPGFKSAPEVAAAVARAHELVQAFEPGAQASRFSTRDRSLLADAALLASAHAVQGFFEEEALDADNQLRVPKSRSINKIGHALHELDPVYSAFSHGPALAELATALGLQQPQLRQSQVIFKQPHIGGEVGWHQDATFFETDPITVTTFWFALEDATLQNGCLWVQPGGHRGPLRQRFVKTEGNRASMESIDITLWPTEFSAVPLEAKAGDLIILHGLLPHYSAPNRSPHSRMAFTLHVTDASSAYSPRNWLQRGVDLPLQGF